MNVEPIVLLPDAVKARFFDLYRGGLPSSSIPGGSRSREVPMPALDIFDRQLQEALGRYLSWLTISQATSSSSRRREAIHHALRIQQWFLLRPEPIEDVYCDDSHCSEMLELGRKSGKCAKHRMRAIRKKRREAASAHGE